MPRTYGLRRVGRMRRRELRFFQPSAQHIAQATLFLIADQAMVDWAAAGLMRKNASKINSQVNF